MSLFEQKHDDALLKVPWLTKETKSGRWLFKYAPHPDRAGYVFVVTDLTVLLFESLTAPSIPTRLAKMVSSSSRTRVTESQRDDVDTAGKALEVLDTLEKDIMVLSPSWNDVEIYVKEDGFYDRVVSVNASTSGKPFTWIFNMAELRSSVPLAFITRHLIGPMASHFAPQSVIPSAQSPLQAVAAMLEDSDLARRISGPRPSTSHSASNDRSQTQQTAYSQTPVAASSTLKSASPVIKDDQSPVSDVLEDIPEDKEVNDEEEYQSSNAPSPAQTRSHDDPIARASRDTPSASPIKVHTSPKKHEAVRTKPSKKSTPPPPKPSVSQLSQKSKREREKEEEESMEKRLEEVRKKMGAGGGGRLSRRRAAR